MTKKGVVDWWVNVNIVTDSIGQSAAIQVTQRPILRFFAPQGRLVAPIGVKLSTDCKKTGTGNGNLQPEIEINEYSSNKKLLE